MARHFQIHRWWCAAVILFYGLQSEAARAGGFQVMEQSVRGLGQSFAGATTGFGDGSSIWYNPAAMTIHEGDLIHLGNNLVIPKADFENEGSSLSPALGGGPVLGGEGGNGGDPAYVPNVYAIKGFADQRLKLGLGLNAPFGLVTRYDDDWVGRYHGIKSDLLTININPAMGFKVNDWLSVGGGVSVMYSDADLTNAVDFGSIGIATLGPEQAAALGLAPQGADGFARVQGDDWGVGYHLGGLLTFGDTRFGVHFRSKLDLELRGRGDFDVPANALPLTSTGLFTNADAAADVTLPENIAFDLYHQVTDDWYLVGGALWTRWTRLEELRIMFDSPQPDNVTPLGWNNTWRFAGGTGYRLNESWQVRGGVSWEKSPIEGAHLRTPRIPDNDRFWLTTGLTYTVNNNFLVDFSYAHVFVQDAGSHAPSSTGNTLDGEYKLSTDIVSIAFTYRT